MEADDPIGTPALYTSESKSLAVLEILAHTTKQLMPSECILITIEIPKNLKRKIKKIVSLPPDWDSLETSEQTQTLGRIEFNENKQLGIVVPSSIIRQEYNIILNPRHKEFNKLKVLTIESFKIDERVVQ